MSGWVTVLGLTQTGARWLLGVGPLVCCVGGDGGCWLLGISRLVETAPERVVCCGC